MEKQGLILAAGRGRRLQTVTDGKPKCMLRIGTRRLIEHQIDILKSVGIDKIGVVTGYQADQLKGALANQCDFIENPDHASTNSLYSLWLARHWVKGPFILMNSDLLAHPDIYHRVLAVNGSCIAYDRESGDDDEHMKVTVRDRKVCAISKDLPPAMVSGENVGVMQFSAEAAVALFQTAGKLIRNGQAMAWAPAAVDHLVLQIEIKAIETNGLPWTEIDFPSDLRAARQYTWPMIKEAYAPHEASYLSVAG